MLTQQKKEIESIKERTITINLSDADCERIARLTGEHGISVSELLENFIGDLVDGTYSNGSDERMYAEQYFERCWFGMFPEETFLRHLLEYGSYAVNSFIMHCDLLEECGEQLAEYEGKELSEDEKQELIGIQEEIEFQKSELKEYYDSYVDSVKKPESYEEGLEKVLEWRKELLTLKGE